MSFQRERLLVLLEEARSRGFLGPGPVAPQLDRSLAFAEVASEPNGLAIDLGTGGGLPGLVMATYWPGSRWVFIEANQRRARWLERAAAELRLTEVAVVAERAEVVGRSPLRYGAVLVTARGFGSPAVTSECGAPLLQIGGRLIVADPPHFARTSSRWPDKGLATLGLRLVGQKTVDSVGTPSTFTVLESAAPCDSRFPRRTGVPAKSPLFGDGAAPG